MKLLILAQIRRYEMLRKFRLRLWPHLWLSKSGIIQTLSFGVNSSPNEKALVSNIRMTRVKQETQKIFKSKGFVLLPKGMDTTLI